MKRLRFGRFLTPVLMLAPAPLIGADAIEDSRKINWQANVNVGVPGGIPTDRVTFVDASQPPFSADSTGATDSSQAIGDAFAHAYANGIKVVKLGTPGTYRVDAGIGVYGGMTLRGASSDCSQTVLMKYGPSGVCVGMSYNGIPGPALDIFESPTKGATVLNVGDTSTFAAHAASGGNPGKILDIALYNDSTLPVWSTDGYEKLRHQKVELRAILNSSTIEIFPALAFDLPSSLSPVARIRVGAGDPPGGQIAFAGVEDLTIDGQNSSTPSALTGFNRGYGCWLKNVVVKNAQNYLVSITDSMFCEIRHSNIVYRQTGGSNGAGILLGNSSFNLVEDNVIGYIFPGIEQNFGCTGNVFAYNYNPNSTQLTAVGASFDANHGPHNSFNLWEGNIIPRFQSDGSFGSTSHETVHANLIHGTSPGATDQLFCITLSRGSYYHNIIGNILGRQGVSYQYNNSGSGFDTLSSTTLAIPTVGGPDVEITVGAGLLYVNNLSVALVRANASNWFTGKVVSYSGTTMTIRPLRVEGSGTYSGWTVWGANGFGTPMIYAFCGPNMGNGGSFGDFVAASAGNGHWWRNWPNGMYMNRPAGFNADQNQGNTSYIPGTVYYSGTVLQTDAMPGHPYLTGGNGILSWLTYSPPDDGTTNWGAPSGSNPKYLSLGANSWQEFDLWVQRTVKVLDNYNVATNSIAVGEGMSTLTGTLTRPASYFRTSKPAWFGNKPWPPIDSHNPPTDWSTETVFAQLLPAAHRWIHGNESYMQSP